MDEESIVISSSLDDNDLLSINTKAKCNPVIVASNNNSSYKMDDNSSCNPLNSNHNKMSVQYANVSTNTQTISCKTDLQLGASKMDHCESEKRSFVSLPIDNLNDLDASSLKAQSSIMNNNQRVLISPTDFLTLSEEASSAVKKDVNLSASRLEIIKMFNDNNLTISLDRYCESPFLLEAHRETHLGDDDDDPSNNGRVSRLSESHDEMTPDDLFASTLTDQHNSLREVVITPLDSESSGTASLARDCIKNINGVDIASIKEEKFETEEIIEETVGPDDNESKPNLTLLNPLEQQMLPISPENINSDSNLDLKNSFTSEATTSNQVQNGSVTVALPVTPLDIKILSPGLLQLAANLAAVFPSSTIQKQIALQLLREDGTSIIVPIATKSQEPINNNTKITISNENRDKTVTDTTNVTMSTDGVANPEADRPFKCELCNSTFTRLGNYTRHKKIHSLSSKVSFYNFYFLLIIYF